MAITFSVWYDTKSTGMKSQDRSITLHQNEKVCIKGHSHEATEATQGMGENKCTYYI